MKKILLGLGTLAAVATSVTAVVACSNKKSSPTDVYIELQNIKDHHFDLYHFNITSKSFINTDGVKSAIFKVNKSALIDFTGFPTKESADRYMEAKEKGVEHPTVTTEDQIVVVNISNTDSNGVTTTTGGRVPNPWDVSDTFKNKDQTIKFNLIIKLRKLFGIQDIDVEIV